ncbi:putative glyoxylate reductase [Microsporum ferrugineum]
MASTSAEPKRKPRVLSLGTINHMEDDYLAEFQKGFDLSVLKSCPRGELKGRLEENIKKHGPVDAFIIGPDSIPYYPFDEDLLSPLLPGCKIISSITSGYNMFSVDWITKQGIWLTSTLDAVAEPTADMALFLLLAVFRNTTNAEKSARAGTWRNNLNPTHDPSGCTLGIVGLGAIGKYLAKKAAVFNMKVIYHNRTQLSRDVESKYGVTYYASLHDMLAVSDAVSICCPLTENTRGLIGPKEFAVMKDGAYLVNTARGPIVDEKSLIEALESGKITRAGLDVFNEEPDFNPYFRTSDKVIIQPHLAGLTDMAVRRAGRECFENVYALFRTGRPLSPVVDIEHST